MNLSKKAEKIQASITLAITAKAKQMKSEGIDVIGFGAGEPDFNTPQYIQEAALDAMKNGFTKYTPAAGIADLRQEIANKFKKDNKFKLWNCSDYCIHRCQTVYFKCIICYIKSRR